MTQGDDFYKDRFHACAMIAYVEVWRETGVFPPDSDTVKHRAYGYYEESRRDYRKGHMGLNGAIDDS